MFARYRQAGKFSLDRQLTIFLKTRGALAYTASLCGENSDATGTPDPVSLPSSLSAWRTVERNTRTPD